MDATGQHERVFAPTPVEFSLVCEIQVNYGKSEVVPVVQGRDPRQVPNVIPPSYPVQVLPRKNPAILAARSGLP